MITAVATIGVSALPACAAQWKYQGTASTGEKIYFNLTSIQPSARRGYFFVYQISNGHPFASTSSF